MSEIKHRKVSRWFFEGKGYSSKSRAITAMAKSQIRKELKAIAYEKCGEDCSTEDILVVWVDTFPHDEEWLCNYNDGGRCAFDGTWEYTGYYGEGAMFEPTAPKYPWCKTKWLARIAEIIEEYKNDAL